jgi:uncharacterized protein (DUF169 family)
MDLQAIVDKLNVYFRPQSFPVAIRLVSSGDEIPKKAKMPKRDMELEMSLCQGVAITRRYGWTMAMGADDMNCPAGALVAGFYAADEKVLSGSFMMPFWGDQEIRAQIVADIPKLEAGKYKYILTAPLEKTTFEPQLILVYGNPAQIARLIQANTLKTGKCLVSASMGAFGCGVAIAKPLIDNQCQATIPGGGERSVAMTQDHEVCFTIPIDKAEAIIDGLEITHKAGTRYPVANFLTFQAEFTPGYQDLMKYLRTKAAT